MGRKNLRIIFGLKLRQLRSERGLSLQECSRRTGLSPSYLNEIENGKKYPKAEKIQQIADALGISYDQLVSQKLDEEHHYLEQALESEALNKFPFHLFGITLPDVVSLVPDAPQEGKALVRALVDTARSYDLRIEDFFHTALRCYQEMHQNYFDEIEVAVDAFRSSKGWKPHDRITHEMLYRTLIEDFGYEIDEALLPSMPQFQDMRSIWTKGPPPKLHINGKFSAIQKTFIAGRELGYLILGITQRGRCSPDIEVQSFDQVVHAFKASYFASALVMNRDMVVADLRQLFSHSRWSKRRFLDLLSRYNATAEMFFYRLSEILPRFFGINRLHFLRVDKDEATGHYKLIKQLNMSHVRIPTGIGLNEHFCRRWISIKSIQELERTPAPRAVPFVGIQRSRFEEDGAEGNREYFCISVARPLTLTPDTLSSVTIGFQVDEALQRVIRFWDDPSIPVVRIGETCERCPLTLAECADRAAPASVFDEARRRALQRDHLAQIV